MIRKYAEIFCWKNVSSFSSAKATHIFTAKNIRILCIESAKTVNEMTLNELVKLTTLWTTGPWILTSHWLTTSLSFVQLGPDCFHYSKPFLKKGLLQKEKNCYIREQILSFQSRFFFFWKGRQMPFGRVPPPSERLSISLKTTTKMVCFLICFD